MDLVMYGHCIEHCIWGWIMAPYVVLIRLMQPNLVELYMSTTKVYLIGIFPKANEFSSQWLSIA